MNNWKEYKFSELCDISRGASPRPIHEYITDGEGMPWVKIADATKSNSRFIEYTAERIKLSGVKKSVEVFKGDLILSNSATPGLPKFMAINACIHDGWMLLRNFKNITKEFAYWLLLNERNNLVKQGTGTVFINLKTDILRNHIVKIPSIEEQNKIVSILNGIEDKIQLNTQINQTLEQIAQALFKSWFVDFDPVCAKVQALSDGLSLEQAELAAMQAISGKTLEELTALSQTQPEHYAELAETAKAFPCEMVEVDGVEVPKGWEVTPLSGLFTLISGTQIPKEEHIYEAKEGYERFIQNRDYSSNNHITYVEISKKNKRCTEKDILIDRYGDAGKIRFGISGVYNIALAKIALNDNNLIEYLRWFLMQPKQKAYFEQASGASTRASLNTSTFKGINVVIPSNFILNIFSKISNTYLDSLRNLKEENNTLMKTRDSLLPKLLNGDI
ncbi:restriction endonuclease subunit S [Haemophilus influenzae]|nr:restriction endonuclease subunit S [Haemophilus influenzae]